MNKLTMEYKDGTVEYYVLSEFSLHGNHYIALLPADQIHGEVCIFKLVVSDDGLSFQTIDDMPEYYVVSQYYKQCFNEYDYDNLTDDETKYCDKTTKK